MTRRPEAGSAAPDVAAEPSKVTPTVLDLRGEAPRPRPGDDYVVEWQLPGGSH